MKKTINELQKALRTDDNYYNVWQANIAMSFYDEFNRNKKKYKSKKDVHSIANMAAMRFLDMLCMGDCK